MGFRPLETDDGRQYPVDDPGVAGLYGRVGSDGYPTLSLYPRCGHRKTLLSHLVDHLLHHSTAVGCGGVGGDDLFSALPADAGPGNFGNRRCRYPLSPIYPDRIACRNHRIDRCRNHVGGHVESFIRAELVGNGNL